MATTQILTNLIDKLPITLWFVVVAWMSGLALSIVVTIGRLSPIRWLSGLLNIYVSFIRSIPMILQLFLIYYGLPQLLKAMGINIDSSSRFGYSVLAFALYYGAYLSEDLRAAYQAVNPLQWDAATALGYNRWQTETRVIVPQTLPIVLPVLGNEILNLLHQSSLLFTIGMVDIMGQAQEIINQNYTVAPVLVYFIAGLVYLIISLLFDWLQAGLEKRTGVYLTKRGVTIE